MTFEHYAETALIEHSRLQRLVFNRHGEITMKTTHEFAPADRYLYDFGLCSSANGFAQVDTSQDASYFGTWANPTLLVIFSYCEGDTTMHECESAEEFAAELRRIDAWNVEQGHGNARIDPGYDPELQAAFERIGLADLLH